MWFILNCSTAFYDFIAEPILELFTAEIVPAIADIFMLASLAFIFVITGTKKWVLPLILAFCLEEVPILNIAPGWIGVVSYIQKQQPQTTEEEFGDNKEEIVARQNDELAEEKENTEFVPREQRADFAPKQQET